MDVRQQVRRYILENYLFSTDGGDLNDQDSLITRGIIDSTGALEVIHFLEETFGISVAEDEMVPENLDSVAQILAFLERKTGAAP